MRIASGVALVALLVVAGEPSAGDSPTRVASVSAAGVTETGTSALAPATPASPTAASPTAPPSTTQPSTTQPSLAPSTTASVDAGTSSTAEPGSLTEWERNGHEALALIDYPWQQRLPEWTIVFSPGRHDVLGFTYTDERRIEVFVRDSQSTELLAHVIAHELGHAVDVDLNTSDERERWQRARGIEDRQWWPGDGLTDFATGAGDFAECFAAWQVGSSEFRSELGPAPTQAQQDLLAELASN